MIKIHILLFLMIVLSNPLTAQDDNLDRELYSQDTVFILLTGDVKATLNGTRSIRPNKKYPKDMSRCYYLDNDLIAFSIFYTDNELDEPFYFLETKEKFHKRNFIESSDLERKSEGDALNLIQDKVLMLVDPSFADSDKYYVVRVFRYAGEE